MHQIYNEESIWGFIIQYRNGSTVFISLILIFVLHPGIFTYILLTFFISCLNGVFIFPLHFPNKSFLTQICIYFYIS